MICEVCGTQYGYKTGALANAKGYCGCENYDPENDWLNTWKNWRTNIWDVKWDDSMNYEKVRDRLIELEDLGKVNTREYKVLQKKWKELRK